MSINTFWKIVIKILGIWIVFESVILVPQYFTNIFYFFGDNFSSNMLVGVLGLTFIVVLYLSVLKLFLFQTDWVIEKLKLEDGFNEERIELNIHRSVIVKIAIVTIGGFLFIDNLPILFTQFYNYLTLREMSGSEYFFGSDNIGIQWSVLYLMKCLIGIWMMTSSRFIVNFLESRRKK